MANKEERIYVGIIDPKGDFCPVPYGTCNSLCDNCKGGMTRQDMIYKIYKVLYRELFKVSNLECEFLAEKVVNALLGVEK